MQDKILLRSILFGLALLVTGMWNGCSQPLPTMGEDAQISFLTFEKDQLIAELTCPVSVPEASGYKPTQATFFLTIDSLQVDGGTLDLSNLPALRTGVATVIQAAFPLTGIKRDLLSLLQNDSLTVVVSGQLQLTKRDTPVFLPINATKKVRPRTQVIPFLLSQ